MVEAPERIQPKSLADYLDVMSKAVFQTGISWRVVNAKWPGSREAFHGFDPTTITHMTGAELEQLTGDTRIIRNRKKIEAIVHNARRMLELDKDHGGFTSYLRSHGSFDALVKDLREQFKYLGDMGAYYFLYVVNEEVPSHEEWYASRGTKPAPVKH
jgi:3-methyladenine DNA glycosylase Tag